MSYLVTERLADRKHHSEQPHCESGRLMSALETTGVQIIQDGSKNRSRIDFTSFDVETDKNLIFNLCPTGLRTRSPPGLRNWQPGGLPISAETASNKRPILEVRGRLYPDLNWLAQGIQLLAGVCRNTL